MTCCMLIWPFMDHDSTMLLMCSLYFFSCSKSLLAICFIMNQPRLDLNDQRDGIFKITYLTLFLFFLPWVGRKIHFYQLSGFFVALFLVLIPLRDTRRYHTFFGGFLIFGWRTLFMCLLFLFSFQICLRSWWGLGDLVWVWYWGNWAVGFGFGIYLVSLGSFDIGLYR